jgi:hypothetical protein
VDDVVATANDYRDKLGFRYERFRGEPPCFTILERSGIHIILSQMATSGHMRPDAAADPEGSPWDAYILVATPMRSTKSSNTVEYASYDRDQPYHCRDFDIQDCNGYTLCFGHTI